MGKPDDFDEMDKIPKPQVAPLSERFKRTIDITAQTEVAPLAERFSEELLEEEVGFDVGSWQNSATLLAGFSATFITLVLGLIGVAVNALYQWVIFFLSLTVFLFLLATEFFALATSKFKIKRRVAKRTMMGKVAPTSIDVRETTTKPYIWYDIGSVFYNIGIATFTAGLIILFSIYGLPWPIYVALVFILAEIILMLYFLAGAIRRKPRHVPSMLVYAVQIVVIALIIFYAIWLIGII